jgi:hypothetical protein
MNLDWHMKPGYCALGAALALAATATLANPSAPQTSAPQTSMQLALADSTEPTIAGAPRDYPPLQAGAWRAAAQGPEALRRYIFRTRMIYEYYYPYFAKQE